MAEMNEETAGRVAEELARPPARRVHLDSGDETTPGPPGAAMSDDFREACADPESVEFTVVGRNGKRVTLVYHANEFEQGHVHFAADIERETEEFGMLGMLTPYIRPTGCSYGKVGLAFTWEPKYPVRLR